MAHLVGKGHNVTFSGYGAAHQNVVAEQAIKTTVYIAQTMFIHVASKSLKKYGNTICMANDNGLRCLDL